MEERRKIPKFPLSYFWSAEGRHCSGTKDGGLVYVGSKSINYIGPIADTKTGPEIDTLHTRQHVIDLDVDPEWGALDGQGKMQKYVAVLAFDKSVQIWNLVNRKAICGHKVHRTEQFPLVEGYKQNTSNVLLRFMKNRNVLSIDRTTIVNYCIASNTYCTFKNFFTKRNDYFTYLECSPNDEEIFAVATIKGTIYLCDLQKCEVLYTLKGHDSPITSLKFNCCDKLDAKEIKLVAGDDEDTKISEKTEDTNINAEEKKISPKQKTMAKVENSEENNAKNFTTEGNQNMGAACDDFVDIYDYNYEVNEFGAPSNDKEEKLNDFVGIEKPIVTPDFDFGEACQALKKDMEVLNSGRDSSTTYEMNEVTLEECKSSQVRCPSSPSCSDHDEPLGSSVELIHNKNNSADEGFDDFETQNQMEFKADVHATPADDSNDEMEVPRYEDDCNLSASKDSIKIIVNEMEDSQSLNPVASRKDKEMSTFEKDFLKDILLVSSSECGKITLWHTSYGSHLDSITLNVKTKCKNVHTNLGWLDQSTLLATNRVGDMYCIHVKAVPKTSENTSYRFQGQSRILQSCSISQFVPVLGEFVWTMSTARIIRLENLKTNLLIGKFCCISSSVTMMKENPDDMNRIALSLPDRRVAVLDISKLSPMDIPIENFSNAVDASCLCVDWSPDGKRLAFGTAEGRVGIINYASKQKKDTFVLDPICGKEVYQVEWNGSNIFVLCNSSIAVYSDDMKNKTGKTIRGIRNVSTFSAHAQYLFVGYKNGSLVTFKRQRNCPVDYEQIEDFEIGQRYVSNISWSYMERNRFIVTCNCNTFAIMSFNVHVGQCHIVKKVSFESELRLGYTQARWSFSDPSKFITCGLDGAIRIWNTDTCDKKPEYIRHFPYPLLSVMFLPGDENIILCAGKCGTLEMFDIRDKFVESKLKKKTDPISGIAWGSKAFKCVELSSNEKRRQKKLLKTLEANLEKEVNDEVNKNEGSQSEANESLEIVNKKLKMLNVTGEPNLSDDDLNVVSLQDVGSHYKKCPGTVLCLITKELNKRPLEKMKDFMLALKNNNSHPESVLSAKLFGSKKDAKLLIEEELKNHRISNIKGTQNLFLPQLNGSIREEIVKATTQKQLNEWLVSLAPSISYNFWQKTVEAYAEQLKEQKFMLQAAIYKISLQKHLDAIDILVTGHLYKEAMLLGKVYLLKEDPLNTIIFKKWLEYLESKGAFFTAAFLCLLAKDFNGAANYLSRVFKKTPEMEEILGELGPYLNKKTGKKAEA